MHGTRRDLPRAIALGMGEALLSVGLVFLLFVVYELWITDVISGHQQEVLSHQLEERWAHAPAGPAHAVTVPAPVPAGTAFAFLYIPRLGADYRRAVVEGTAQQQLAQGPAHYTGTAMPGEKGNVAIAGHRVGKGSPFLDLDQLEPGDPVVVETATSWFTYRVLGDRATGNLTAGSSGIPGEQVVSPTDVAVIAPTPGVAGSSPSGSYLTMTTCNPKYSDSTRLIVHAVLDSAVAKADAPGGPAALREH
jgi:sortase A